MRKIPEDIWRQMLAFEAGELPEADIVPLFQFLINEGHAWRLQGFYGRTAHQLIDAGFCVRPLIQNAKGQRT